MHRKRRNNNNYMCHHDINLTDQQNIIDIDSWQSDIVKNVQFLCNNIE